MTLKKDPEEQLAELQQEQAAQEDSESSTPAAPELSAAARAKKLADEILHTPTTTDQAIELAKVYALIAIAEALPPKSTPARRTTTKKATS